jgi:hypothetical protein
MGRWIKLKDYSVSRGPTQGGFHHEILEIDGQGMYPNQGHLTVGCWVGDKIIANLKSGGTRVYIEM